MTAPLLIEGSARSDGDTAALVAVLRSRLSESVEVSLSGLEIAPFAYGARPADAFGVIVDAMLASDDIVFATPVYWYAMSGRMKTLFDRLTDLLHDREQHARKRALTGRRGWMVAVGTDPELPPGFDEPFARTVRYFGMNWAGCLYLNTRSPDWLAASDGAITALIARIEAARGRNGVPSARAP